MARGNILRAPIRPFLSVTVWGEIYSVGLEREFEHSGMSSIVAEDPDKAIEAMTSMKESLDRCIQFMEGKRDFG